MYGDQKVITYEFINQPTKAEPILNCRKLHLESVGQYILYSF